jgi:hypothetical protein
MSAFVAPQFDCPGLRTRIHLARINLRSSRPLPPGGGVAFRACHAPDRRSLGPHMSGKACGLGCVCRPKNGGNPPLKPSPGPCWHLALFLLKSLRHKVKLECQPQCQVSLSQIDSFRASSGGQLLRVCVKLANAMQSIKSLCANALGKTAVASAPAGAIQKCPLSGVVAQKVPVPSGTRSA